MLSLSNVLWPTIFLLIIAMILPYQFLMYSFALDDLYWYSSTGAAAEGVRAHYPDRHPHYQRGRPSAASWLFFFQTCGPKIHPPLSSAPPLSNHCLSLYISPDVVIVKCHLTNHLFTCHRNDITISIFMYLFALDDLYWYCSELKLCIKF